MSTGFAALAPGSRKSRNRFWLSLSNRTSRPRASQVSAHKNARAAGVRDNSHAVAARQRLIRQQRSHVEQLFERIRANDAGLSKQRIDRDIRSGNQRARM